MHCFDLIGPLSSPCLILQQESLSGSVSLYMKCWLDFPSLLCRPGEIRTLITLFKRQVHQTILPRVHKRHLITVLCRLANLVHFLFPAFGYPSLTDLRDARMVEMFSNNSILLKVITGSYSLLSQTRYGLQRVLLSPTAVFLVLPEGLKPSTLSLGRICADSIAPWEHLNKSREVYVLIISRNLFQ